MHALKRFHGEAWVRLAEAMPVAGADDFVEVLPQAQVFQDGPRVGLIFIGKDGELVAFGLELLQEPVTAGQSFDIVIHDGAKVLAKVWDRGFAMLGSAKFFQRDRHGAADCGAHGRVVAFRQSELSLSEGNTPVDCAEVVDQRAVEIKENGWHKKMCFIRIDVWFTLANDCMGTSSCDGKRRRDARDGI